MSKDIFMRIIELNANIVHILANKHHKRGKLVSHERRFLFSLLFVRERHKARDGLRADQGNFNLKIHKLSISK